MNYFANNILYLRKKSNLRQGQMHEHVQISRGTWSNYENGITEPPFNKLIEIAKFFRIRLDLLLLEDLAKLPHVPEDKINEAEDFLPKKGDNYNIDVPEKQLLQENEETTLWYLLKEMKGLRKDLDKIKKKDKPK